VEQQAAPIKTETQMKDEGRIWTDRGK